ncbi:hypothetical protein D3C73_1375440 [compost metagenome]
MAAAGTQILVEKLRCYPKFNGFQQRVAEVIVVMALDTDQFRCKQRQPKRTGADERLFRVRQMTAVAGQTVCQPEVGAM